MSDWDHDAAKLLGRVASDRVPPAAPSEAKERVRAALIAGIGTIAFTAAPPTTPPKTGGFSAALALKIGIPVAVLALVGAGVLLRRSGHEATRMPTPIVSVVATESAAPIAAPEAPIPEPAALPVASGRPGASVRATAGASASASKPARAEDESALVAAIDRALRAHENEKAAALIAEHEKRFANGVLVEERALAKAILQCARNSGTSSRDAFLRTYPRTPHRARLEEACGKP